METALKSSPLVPECRDFLADGERRTDVTDEISVVRLTLDELETFAGPWQALAHEAGDVNPFYERWCFLPAARLLGQGVTWHLLAAFRRDPTTGVPSELVGVFPFERTRGPFGVDTLSLWNHPYGFLATPLVHRDWTGRVLDAVLLSLRQTSARSLIRFPCMNGDGLLHSALIDCCHREVLTTYRQEQYVRAMLRRPADWEAYFEANVSGHHKREYRRQRRRLESAGQLEFRRMVDPKTAYLWINSFLDLEAKGWKASQGTAIRQNESHAQFFAEMVVQGAAAGRVEMIGFFLDGEPIALKCNFVASPGSFAFKVAYDESLRKLSPGVQLEIENIKSLSANESIDWMDSCASPHHPMVNRIWRERRPIQSLLIANGHWTHEIVMGVLPAIRSLNRLKRQIFNRSKKS